MKEAVEVISLEVDVEERGDSLERNRMLYLFGDLCFQNQLASSPLKFPEYLKMFSCEQKS